MKIPRCFPSDFLMFVNFQNSVRGKMKTGGSSASSSHPLSSEHLNLSTCNISLCLQSLYPQSLSLCNSGRQYVMWLSVARPINTLETCTLQLSLVLVKCSASLYLQSCNETFTGSMFRVTLQFCSRLFIEGSVLQVERAFLFLFSRTFSLLCDGQQSNL